MSWVRAGNAILADAAAGRTKKGLVLVAGGLFLT